MHTATFGFAVPRDRRVAFAQGLFRLVDPKIALASLVPFLVGLGLARSQGYAIPATIAISAFAAIFLVEVGKNAINDLIDFRSGADSAVTEDERSPFSGGKRVLIDGLLTQRDLVFIAWIAMLGAGVLGLRVALATTPALLLLGAAAAAVAVAYSIPPFKLSYRGLGEAAVFLTYGPGIVIGSVLLFGGRITGDVLAAAVSLGLIIANVLFINEMPDERADRSAGKNTLVVRLGRHHATDVFGYVFVAAFALPLVMFLAGGHVALIGLLAGVIPADFAVWSLRAERVKPPVAAQTATLLAYVVSGAGILILLWLARL